MALGKKTGGRLRGTPIRRTLDVQTMLVEMGCDPIAGMARIAMDIGNPVELRARMYAELAQYVAPKRKAVQVESGASNRVVFNIGIAARQSAGIGSDDSATPLVIAN